MSTTVARHFDLSTLYDKPVVQKAKPSPKTPLPAQEVAAKWIHDFDEAIRARDAAAVAALFQEDGSTSYFFFVG